MGNSQNKNLVGREVEVLHEKFKMVEVLENSEEMILSIPYQQKQDIVEWQKLLKNVRDCDPEFLLMPKKYMIAEQGICGSSGIIKIVYDCFTFSFEQQISNHAQKYKHFEQEEIWYLLFAIISSVKQLDRLSIKVGDIRPHNIFVNENGQVKLSGVYSWPGQVQNYLKTSYDKVLTYLSPEQLHQCRVGEKAKRSHIIGESFSVGLTLLHTCLLKPMDELYNLKKFQFNTQKLQQQLNELKKLTFWNEEKQKNDHYSSQLISIIARLLELNENQRLTTLQLFDSLQPHAEEILNLRQFEIPQFNLRTPTKQMQKPILINENQTISPQYSSIKKQPYNEPESIPFQTGYRLPNNTSTSNVLPNRIPPTVSVLLGDRKTPQKRLPSKEKMQISLSSEKTNVHPKTSQAPRQSLSKQKLTTKTQVNFTVPKPQIQPKPYQVNHPSNYQFVGEFKTNETYNKSNLPSSLSTFKPTLYEVPSFNYTGSNYVSYQRKYEIPSKTTQYQGSSQPMTFYYNQPVTDFNYNNPNFGYNNQIYENKMNPSNLNNYSFTRNVELAQSQYTVIGETNKKYSAEIRDNLQNNHLNASQLQTSYQTSMVKPVMPSQLTFSTGLTAGNDRSQPSHILKKIDEQLNKSRQLFPNGTTF